MNQPLAEPELQTVSLYAAQPKIYPRAVHGWFAVWRWALVFLTQAVFYGMPWWNWNGRQAVLFDLEARRFFIFDLVLYPQDLVYLTALLLISAYALFLFTAVAGRLWCGYACPQTVYTEIFLWIERHTEGDRGARIRLDRSDLSVEKVLRKSAKHAGWLAVSLWTGFTFVGYFTPIRTLGDATLQGLLGGWQTFWILFYSLATYGNAGFLREQVCKYMCPYARFQSAMFDKDTLVISYDPARGEPRGPRSKKLGVADLSSANVGSCVDCKQCVQVCPTGIDIRNGLQYECIGCAACIDACNGVMDSFEYPRGLIRYATQNGMQKGWTSAQQWRRVFRPRVMIYSVILWLLAAAMVWSLATRLPFRADVVRDRAALARQVEDGYIENVYRLQLMNASGDTLRLRLEVSGLDTAAFSSAQAVHTLAPAEARWVTVALRVPPETAGQLRAGAHPLQFRIQQVLPDGAPGRVLVEKSTFVIPR